MVQYPSILYHYILLLQTLLSRCLYTNTCNKDLILIRNGYGYIHLSKMAGVQWISSSFPWCQCNRSISELSLIDQLSLYGECTTSYIMIIHKEILVKSLEVNSNCHMGARGLSLYVLLVVLI